MMPNCTWTQKYQNAATFFENGALRPRQNGHHFADDTFNRIFVNENVRISIKFSLKFVPKGSINNNPALVQIMAWRRPGDTPLSEPMIVNLPTHICVTRPQWVKDDATAISTVHAELLWLKWPVVTAENKSSDLRDRNIISSNRCFSSSRTVPINCLLMMTW